MGKRMISLFVPALFIFIFYSCGAVLSVGAKIAAPMALKYESIQSYHIIESWNDTTGRRIVQIGVTHIGKPAYYADLKHRLDSLRGEGYVIYFEAIGYREDDSIRMDTLNRKMRKVLGAHILDNYLDKDNKSNKPPYNVKKYVAQDPEYLGIDPDSSYCVHADMLIPDLIARFERDRGEIVLTDYDWETPLKAKYSQRKSGNTVTYEDYVYFLREMRENYVLETVAANDHPKIVILYGRRHLDPIYRLLRDSLGFKSERTRQLELEAAREELPQDN